MHGAGYLHVDVDNYEKAKMAKFPEFKVTTTINNPKSMDNAVGNFVNSSHCKENKLGLYHQTLEGIAGIVINKPNNSFLWLAEEGSNVVAYALTHTSKDVDNKMCYWMTQAWMDPKYRNTGYSKQCLAKLRQHAKDLYCKHILIPSSRSTKAYLRFLGSKWHTYVEILKEDI